jgi:hypothetical protein
MISQKQITERKQGDDSLENRGLLLFGASNTEAYRRGLYVGRISQRGQAGSMAPPATGAFGPTPSNQVPHPQGWVLWPSGHIDDALEGEIVGAPC